MDVTWSTVQALVRLEHHDEGPRGVAASIHYTCGTPSLPCFVRTTTYEFTCWQGYSMASWRILRGIGGNCTTPPDVRI